MPSCAELAKRIDELESRLLNESDRMTDRIVDKIVVQMQTTGVDVLELKKHVDSLESSLKFLNDLVEKLHSEKASLVVENEALKSAHFPAGCPNLISTLALTTSRSGVSPVHRARTVLLYWRQLAGKLDVPLLPLISMLSIECLLKIRQRRT